MAKHDPDRRPNPVWRLFERVVLGLGMSVVAWGIERQLLKGLKRGSVEPAARTAAGSEAAPEEPSVSFHPSGGPPAT